MKVYKFYCAERAIKVLEERRLRLSKCRDMNDPFEMVGVRILDADLRDRFIEYVGSSVGAMCFSRQWSNPLMWSHYADKHRGICLAFELGGGYEPELINYVDSIVDLDIDLDRPADRQGQGVFRKVLLTKFRDWQYEDEVRLLFSVQWNDESSQYLPFGEDLALTDVILGVRCTADLGRILGAAMMASPSARLRQATIADGRFEMVEPAEGEALRKLARQLASAEAQR